jgi:hypothetical protein
MGEDRKLRKNLWYYGAIYLGLIGLWWLASAGWFGFENRLSQQRFLVMMINKTGLLAMIFAGRQLLFPENRSSRIFGGAMGSSILLLIVTKMWLNPSFSLGVVLLAEMGDGLIWCLTGAWFLELVGAIYWNWFLVKIQAPLLSGLKQQIEIALFKLGLFNAGVICFLELYWVNTFAVEMIPVGYYLLIPFLGIGIGLYGVYTLRMNHWIEEWIRVVDYQLLSLLEGKMGDSLEPLLGLTLEENQQTQLLLLWRRYLGDLKKPGFNWWVVGVYSICSGLIMSLPYWIKAVVEV